MFGASPRTVDAGCGSTTVMAQFEDMFLIVNHCSGLPGEVEPGEMVAVDVNTANNNDQPGALGLRVTVDGPTYEEHDFGPVEVPANTGSHQVTLEFPMPSEPGDYDVRVEETSKGPA